MDESALRISLRNLDASWSVLEHWLWLCAFVVFLGVATEVVPIVWEHVLELWDFRRRTIHSPERPSNVKFVLDLFGSALVALGILGELIVGIKMAKVETDLRNDTAKLVAIVDEKAASATRLARGFESQITEANARAKAAEAVVASANAASREAVVKVATAEARIAEANARADEAKKEAELERLARVKIQEQLSWRDLSPSQIEHIRGRLVFFAGQKFDVVTYPSEGECLNLANILYGTAIAGRWILDPNRKWHALFSLVIGVSVHYSGKAGKSTKEAASALADALNVEHLSAVIEPAPETDFPDPTVIGIYIGRNPSSMKPIAFPQ